MSEKQHKSTFRKRFTKTETKLQQRINTIALPIGNKRFKIFYFLKQNRNLQYKFKSKPQSPFQSTCSVSLLLLHYNISESCMHIIIISHHQQPTMRKSCYYEFFPTKAVEQAAIASGKPYEVTKTIVEIRDFGNPPQFDPKNPWQIRKSVTGSDVYNGKLVLSHYEIFEHVFRYWTLDLCNYVDQGNQYLVIIADYTDEGNPKRFKSENIFVQGNHDIYFLGWTDVVQSLHLQPGDEIGLFWDASSSTFGFKLLSRGNSPKN